MSLQVDRQPNRSWIDERGLYLFSTHREVRARNLEKLRALNSPLAPVATFMPKNSGACARDAKADAAGGLPQTSMYCRGARYMLTTGLCQEWGLYNGAIGVVVDIAYSPGERPPKCMPAVMFVEFNSYSGPSFITKRPRIVPIAPVERRVDCSCPGRCARTMIPGQLAWGATFHKAQGLTVGPGCDIECVVVHPPTAKFEGQCPGAIYVGCSRAKTEGRGRHGEPGFAPSALYVGSLTEQERFAVKITNHQVAGRNAQPQRLIGLA